ncbi:hypothetical protein BLX24_13945 [Arsenicibacter rosenii]|uniref:Uncharacterized protein n=1 Tax=Arsenicibacter rosenii TaxID=1750698 RepID=A0A1S2VIT8_9BACT|nr:hypothetical protein BLX24_13945 [Arsenicibacter rosenii]
MYFQVFGKKPLPKPSAFDLVALAGTEYNPQWMKMPNSASLNQPGTAFVGRCPVGAVRLGQNAGKCEKKTTDK